MFNTNSIEILFATLNSYLTKKSLVNTYYDDSVNKLYQVNSDGTRGSEIKMGMPLLDFANPLKEFTANNTYTATQDCYLAGSVFMNDSQYVKINDTILCAGSGTATGYPINTYIPPVKLKSGDSIAVASNSNRLKIYKER